MPENEKQLSEISTFTVGDYRVEPAALRVIGNDQTSRLEPRTMQLLVYFAIHAGRVISRTELEEHGRPALLAARLRCGLNIKS